MNTNTGEIKYFTADEILKPPWVPCEKPNPDCKACSGKGSILYDVSKTLYVNRAERRRAMKAGLPTHKYLPCPECAGKKA